MANEKASYQDVSELRKQGMTKMETKYVAMPMASGDEYPSCGWRANEALPLPRMEVREYISLPSGGHNSPYGFMNRVEGRRDETISVAEVPQAGECSVEGQNLPSVEGRRDDDDDDRRRRQTIDDDDDDDDD